MPFRLREDPVTHVDQDDGEVRGGGAGGHVARVLRVPGRVGEDELAARRLEIAVGDVNGDPLLALGLESVGEEREVDRVAVAGDAADMLDLIVVERAGLVEQPADQRGLAIVHRADDHQPDQLLEGPQREGVVDDCAHQKYPSRFLVSIEPSSS